MLLKSAAIGIPVIASLKYPSDMGVKLANHYNIAIISRITTEKPYIYANEERIILK
jgi:formate dehydrogenase assembly factor FdhD